MGEAVLKDIARKRGVPIVVDSCGTAGYHVGEEPDERCVQVIHICMKRGGPCTILTSFGRRTIETCKKVCCTVAVESRHAIRLMFF